MNTIAAALGRKVRGVDYSRTRIKTEDGDFLDLDWSKVGSNSLVVALHGLEGNSERPYMRGMIRQFNRNGWDGLAMNFRGCSGEPNLTERSYHMGDTEDLNVVLAHIFERYEYDQVALVGFSMGGNVVLKYVGEMSDKIDSRIKVGVAFSVPIDVASANGEMEKWFNWHYRHRLVSSLNGKFKTKVKAFPDKFSRPERGWANTFRDFDEHYTAPVHGFKDVMDYWTQCSSLQYLQHVRIPCLLVNSKDDSFLSEKCFPIELAKSHQHLHLETPEFGGHVGFVSNYEDGSYWTERRAVEFINRFTAK